MSPYQKLLEIIIFCTCFNYLFLWDFYVSYIFIFLGFLPGLLAVFGQCLLLLNLFHLFDNKLLICLLSHKYIFLIRSNVIFVSLPWCKCSYIYSLSGSVKSSIFTCLQKHKSPIPSCFVDKKRVIRVHIYLSIYEKAVHYFNIENMDKYALFRDNI